MAAIQELRAALTPDLREELETRANRALLDLFAIVRRLQPGDVRAMLLCHRALVRAMKRDLAIHGFADAVWADFPRLVFNVLEDEGFEYTTNGRWVRARAWAREAAHG